jgi:histidine triad (HIT) family protein
MSCLFCKFADGTVPTTAVYEDDLVLAIPDIRPQAPVHFLVIPKEHIASLADADEDQGEVLGRLLDVAAQVARGQGLKNGYRVVINTGEDGGQTVDHLHLHVLGGRPMAWPPG